MATTVNMFWHGGPLPSYARACMRSFLERGHRVRLYAYHRLDPPMGVEHADAALIVNVDELKRYQSKGAFSDAFRYELLHREGGWWVDADVVCLTDRLPEADYAWAEQEPGVINGAILKFPRGDAKLAQLVAGARAASGDPTWGAIGPHLLSKVLRGHEPPGRADATRQFYPLGWIEAPLLLLPEYKSEIASRMEGALFLHLWAHVLREVGVGSDDDVPRGSLMYDLLKSDADVRSTWWAEFKTRRAINKYWRQHWVRELWHRRFNTGTPPRVRYLRF